MPYLTSGLVALKQPKPETVFQFVELARDVCAPCAVYVVQANGGRTVIVAVEARVGHDGEPGDVSLFADSHRLGPLAKHLGVPLWGGFAEGGYTNTQRALALDAKGKVRWRTGFEFRYPAKVEAQGLFPLQHPDANAKLYAAERAKVGYGRIGAELKCDFYELLSIERGDPLAKVPFLAVDEKTSAKRVAAWLKTYKPVKPEKVERPTAVYLSLDGERQSPVDDAAVIATTVALARKLHRLAPLEFALGAVEGEIVIGLRGPGIAELSGIALRQPFCDFVSEFLASPVRVVSTRGQRIIASAGRMNANVRLRGLGGRPFQVPADLEWRPLPAVPNPVLVKFEQGLRKWAKRKAAEPAQAEVIIGSGLFG